ncbi:MAG TPA: class I SAM-dependent methyltransferase [Solirubrobacteraceae bacterium]|jgi:ubiquinone/menaquinone biosynthesis C-methylase UbiE|nr:class I SAM-dependent methyltransferase [Solirubrobacteraceae bacterium]
MSELDVAQRVEHEREFYNETSGASRYRLLRRIIWRAIGEFNRHGELDSMFDPAGKVVLQYGCGPGLGVDSLLERGAVHVTGIDISEEEINRARESAASGGYADRVDFRAADAHATGFDDDSFDLIVGHSILHHLDLPVALRELRRLLRPGGRAVFLEPLAGNPLLRLGRRLTPAARTDDEHPLTVADWQLCSSIFDNFSHVEVELLSIPLMPLNLIVPRRLQRPFARLVARADDALLRRFPRLRPYARLSFLLLE